MKFVSDSADAESLTKSKSTVREKDSCVSLTLGKFLKGNFHVEHSFFWPAAMG